MDLTRPVIYRDFALNDISVVAGDGVGKGITGCAIDSADYSDVDVIQFLEKRSLQDGMDAGDVFLGARRLRMAGTISGLTRALLYDGLNDLRAALSPTLAQREEPADKGYRPLYFSVPTNRIDEFPEGAIDMRVLVRPHKFQAVFQRDQQGGEDTDALSIPWQATFLMKDPSLQGELPVDIAFADTVEHSGTAGTNDLITSAAHGLVAGNRVYFTVLTGGTGLSLNTAYYVIASGLTSGAFKVSTTSGGSARDITVAYSALKWASVATASGNFVNRGNYHAPLNMLFVVSALAGTIVVSAGSSTFTITVPASTGQRIIRYKGQDKILTVEEEDTEELRMDLITFQNSTTHPLIPGGTSPYTVTFTGVVLDPGTTDGSHMWNWEVYA